ncbi:hypothetical protein SKAU_G00165630 [Synaphobranchus kaupii]|uniref:Uncharacterized protein n=1 Tax=Synaphobranchus kaupii TaxID=118154 RepID=A0A9Q1FJC9_SYNKA|nr:hypothetical protein SKAU_G00165630 [Synaphobranchus kaupii]
MSLKQPQGRALYPPKNFTDMVTFLQPQASHDFASKLLIWHGLLGLCKPASPSWQAISEASGADNGSPCDGSPTARLQHYGPGKGGCVTPSLLGAALRTA